MDEELNEVDLSDEDDRMEVEDKSNERKEAIKDVLKEDPRSNYRRDKCTDKLYYFNVDNVKITCWFDDDIAEVLKVELE